MNMISKYLNKIDYTLLDESASEEQIKSVCENAIKLGVASVCVYPIHAKYISKYLKGSEVNTCIVCNFPKGDKYDKAWLMQDLSYLAANDIDEVDLVINYNFLKEKWEEDLLAIDEMLTNQISIVQTVIRLLKERQGKYTTLKVIVEAGELNQEQLEYVTKLCINMNVDYIKTSTGKTPVGANIFNVFLIKHTIEYYNSPLKIKASGGLKTIQQLEEIDQYVDRFGMSYKTVDELFYSVKN